MSEFQHPYNSQEEKEFDLLSTVGKSLSREDFETFKKWFDEYKGEWVKDFGKVEIEGREVVIYYGNEKSMKICNLDFHRER